MTDDERKLLEEHGVLVLPEELEHSVYVLVLTACLMRPDKEIRLYCRGNGGDTRASYAIIDLIHQHGNFTGLLPSEANSNHGVIFAACHRRYVYPYGQLGIHRTALSEMYHIDAPYAKNRYEEFEAGDRMNACVYGKACKDSRWGEAFWYRQIDTQGSRGLVQFDAAFLIECGMARPIVEMDQ
jgi:hypothetical protein